MMECDRQTDSARAVEGPAAETQDFASLQGLLEEQLTAAREGNLSRVEQLGELTNAAVVQIVQHRGAALAVSADLERLYRELLVILEAEQADVQDRLKQLRQVKMAMRAYRTDR